MKLPLTDLIASLAIVGTEEEVFLSIRYVSNKNFSLEDVKAWLAYETSQFLKDSGVNFDEVKGEKNRG